jgi:hypothetical protein
MWAPKEAYNGWEWGRIAPKPKIIEINQALGDTTKIEVGIIIIIIIIMKNTHLGFLIYFGASWGG